MDGDAASRKGRMRSDGGMFCLHSPLKGFGGFSASFKPGSWLKSWFLQGLACMESLNPSERRRRLSALRELGISSGNEAQAEVRGFLQSQPRLELLNQRFPALQKEEKTSKINTQPLEIFACAW